MAEGETKVINYPCSQPMGYSGYGYGNYGLETASMSGICDLRSDVKTVGQDLSTQISSNNLHLLERICAGEKATMEMASGIKDKIDSETDSLRDRIDRNADKTEDFKDKVMERFCGLEKLVESINTRTIERELAECRRNEQTQAIIAAVCKCNQQGNS